MQGRQNTSAVNTSCGPSGAPSLLPGWLAVADVAAETRLAPVDPNGEIVGTPLREPVLAWLRGPTPGIATPPS